MSKEQVEIEELMRLCGRESSKELENLNVDQRRRLSTLVVEEAEIARPMMLVVLIWCVSSYFNLSKSGVFYHVDSCSSAWWTYTAMELPTLLVVMAMITWKSIRKYSEKKQLTWQPDVGDIDWNFRKAILYPSAAMGAGALGGLLGIGGGMV
ncbi:hypothetical protein RFI_10551, partial [Reticulomyxa filosa]